MAGATPHANDVDVDGIFDVLSCRRRRIALGQLLKQRRAVLGHLQLQLPPVTIEELAVSIAAVESTERTGPSARRDGIVTSLKHHHLPKLADSRMIDFDPDRGLITVREAALAVEPYLKLAGAAEREGHW